MDTVRNANSGLGGYLSSLILHMFYSKILLVDPENPDWEDRDRFVMSVGHNLLFIYHALFCWL